MRILTILGLLFTVFVSSCMQDKSTQSISVSIIPQKFFIHQIIGDTTPINVMVPPGGSPSTYEPTPQQMQSLSHSALYFSIGHLGFEKAWMSKLSSVNPEMKIIDTSKGLQLMEDEELDNDHSHDHSHGHSHLGYNPHTWLSPSMVKHQANIIYKELVHLYPEKQEAMQMNLHRFVQQCDSVDQALKQQFTPLKGQSFIVYHPVWTYLARDLEIKQVSIEHNGKEATADKLKHIIDYAKEHNIHTLFVQQEFSDAQAKTIAKEINGKVVPLNPLAYDWFDSMNAFANAFE